MERVAIVARLKPGATGRARELVAAGPPFDLANSGIERHSVFVSAREVVFVFEGHQVEWIVDELIDGPFHYELQRAFRNWRAIVDGPPRIARQLFGWGGDDSALTIGEVRHRRPDRRRRRPSLRLPRNALITVVARHRDTILAPRHLPSSSQATVSSSLAPRAIRADLEASSRAGGR
jgi:hypothetical protein